MMSFQTWLTNIRPVTFLERKRTSKTFKYLLRKDSHKEIVVFLSGYSRRLCWIILVLLSPSLYANLVLLLFYYRKVFGLAHQGYSLKYAFEFLWGSSYLKLFSLPLVKLIKSTSPVSLKVFCLHLIMISADLIWIKLYLNSRMFKFKLIRSSVGMLDSNLVMGSYLAMC